MIDTPGAPTLDQRIAAAANRYQGLYKRVLCVCSAGMLRSPTAALVLSQDPFNFNTRAAGVSGYALVQVDPVLIEWADEIVAMEPWHRDELVDRFKPQAPIHVLNILDQYEYRNSQLREMIAQRYQELARESGGAP